MGLSSDKYSALCKDLVNRLQAIVDDSKNPKKKKIYALIDDFEILLSASNAAFEHYKAEQLYVQERKNDATVHFSEVITRQKKIKSLLEQQKVLLGGNQDLLKNNIQELKALLVERQAIETKIAKLEAEKGFKWYYIFALPWIAFLIEGIRTGIAESQIALEKLGTESLEQSITSLELDMNKRKQVINQLESSINGNEPIIRSLEYQMKQIEKQKNAFAQRTQRALQITGEIKLLLQILQDLSEETNKYYLIETNLERTINYHTDLDETKSLTIKEALPEWGKVVDDVKAQNFNAVQILCVSDKEQREIAHIRHRTDNTWNIIPGDLWDSFFQQLDPGKTSQSHYEELVPMPYGVLERTLWTMQLSNGWWELFLDLENSLVTATATYTRETITWPITDMSGFNTIHFFSQPNMNLEVIEILCKKMEWRIATPMEITAAWTYLGMDSKKSGMLSDGRFAIPDQSGGLSIKLSNERQGFYFLLPQHRKPTDYPKVAFHHSPGIKDEQIQQICIDNNWRPAKEKEIIAAHTFQNLDIRNYTEEPYVIGRISDDLYARPLQSIAKDRYPGPNILMDMYRTPPINDFTIQAFMPGTPVAGFFYVDQNQK